MAWYMIAGIVLIAAIAAAVFEWQRCRRMYHVTDKMLDEILNREEITVSDIHEGQLSALAGKAMRVQERMENEIARAEQEKEQIKSLISNMSHQLKTPLASLMMYREILENDSLEEEQRKQFQLKMKQQAEKIDWLTASLFKMVRLEQGAIEFEASALSLKKTLRNAVNTVYGKAEKKQIEIITEPFTDCNVYHNSKWTAEVFENILENAVKYTDKGGEIHIRVNSMELYTEVRIEDTGIGIREEEWTEIFKRFYRSKDVEHKEGTGIGLYLSRLILEKEKGYMTVKSTRGKGSCFSVFLQNCKDLHT